MLSEKQKGQLEKIGIDDLNIVTKPDVIKAATAYMIKKIDKDSFYYCTSNMNVLDLLDAIKILSQNNAEIEKEILDVIKRVVKSLDANLSKADTIEEKQKIREDLMKCLEAAREMSSREFKKYMMTLGLIAVTLAVMPLLLALIGKKEDEGFDDNFLSNNDYFDMDILEEDMPIIDPDEF